MLTNSSQSFRKGRPEELFVSNSDPSQTHDEKFGIQGFLQMADYMFHFVIFFQEFLT